MFQYYPPSNTGQALCTRCNCSIFIKNSNGEPFVILKREILFCQETKMTGFGDFSNKRATLIKEWSQCPYCVQQGPRPLRSSHSGMLFPTGYNFKYFRLFQSSKMDYLTVSNTRSCRKTQRTMSMGIYDFSSDRCHINLVVHGAMITEETLLHRRVYIINQFLKLIYRKYRNCKVPKSKSILLSH